jgi:hypothetical protein
MVKKKAHELEPGDVIIWRNKPFFIYEIDREDNRPQPEISYENYVENESLWDNEEDLLPEHTRYLFTEEYFKGDKYIVNEFYASSHLDEFVYLGYSDGEDVQPQGARTVNPRLRFEILHRDGFKCVLCGANAATGATLQIDHIMPFSFGGRTTKDNLQTLCFDCNIGKSNKYISSPEGSISTQFV